MDKVSVIVPVYNVELYLEQCVESCVNQDYENIEVLLIDDGSTDNSGIICDALAKKYNNVYSFHKKNGGLSDARNFGIDHATGEFIMFVDSDDITDCTLVSTLYKGICKTDCNISVCGLTHFIDGELPKYIHKFKYNYIDNEAALIDFLYQKRITTSACAKLYKKKLLMANRFVMGQRFEDNDFLFRILLNCENVCLNQSTLYAYRHRKDSITTGDFSEKEFDIIDIGDKILNQSNEKKETVMRAAKMYQLTNCLRVILTVNYEYLDDCRYLYCKDYISKHYMEALLNNNVRLKVKVGLLLYKIGLSQDIMRKIRNSRIRWK